ncbi:ribose-5-phosphate isomerase RpiA [Paenibacillus radicis (ex Xue et al. 2023)]|uniref:Ribose-5-phosphate isomerase A n=1 Tax=Paenibacillus radicis (ex Xue et al. 2023) TaxID=2972489 RepID=A0ABT1YF20_9BACL|nr:ribose-5-phosphate isomerase RpiA [Paenibacillus radicis (ex Xue et al. 2023)]MCR8631792.1 ribose-5-phosphate isomerase RpiA [Paenibacillus radicis (ex Xue et al. 2023)]
MNSKKLAAEKAVEFIEDGMTVGLGTGSTAYWAIQKIGERIKEGLSIQAAASSVGSEDLAKQLGIPLIPLANLDLIDITIDGADEVDNNLNLIKGGGGALLREKIIASNSKKFIVIIDESKQVDQLGRFRLSVEIVPFASNLTINKLRELECDPQVRSLNNKPYITDNGNLIIDCDFGKIPNPEALNGQINLIPGVVENGLFIQMASLVVVGFNDGAVKAYPGQSART